MARERAFDGLRLTGWPVFAQRMQPDQGVIGDKDPSAFGSGRLTCQHHDASELACGEVGRVYEQPAQRILKGSRLGPIRSRTWHLAPSTLGTTRPHRHWCVRELTLPER